MKNYYTAREARERLHTTESNFYYLVRTNKIKKFPQPGKKQSVYSKQDVDRLAREILAFLSYDETQKIQFIKATEDDIQEEYDLATFMFGSAVHTLETRHAWLRKNPDTDFIVRDEGKLVGFINILPVKHETIMKFIKGEIKGWDISADDILEFEPQKKFECIIMGMAVTPEAERIKRTQYGARLISGLINFLEGLAKQQTVIAKFYATSLTPTGIAILRNAGFQELEVGRIGKRIAFELDMMTSEASLAREYRKAITDVTI